MAFTMLMPFIIYSPAFKAPFVLDDISKIAQNPDLENGSFWKRMIFRYNSSDITNTRRNDPSRPLVYLTFFINHQISGNNSYGYHLLNVFIHSLNALLIFLLVRAIFIKRFPENWLFISSFAALTFAVHPANSYVASYIFSRSDSLALFFNMLALLGFIRLSQQRNILVLGLSLFFFVCALFSKQSAITLPTIILAYDYFFIAQFQLSELKKRALLHSAFWITAIGYIMFRIALFGGIGDLEALEVFDRFPYLITQPYVILKYMKMLIWPSGFSFEHSVYTFSRFTEFNVLLPVVVLTALSGTAGYLLVKKRTEFSILLGFCWAWFLVTLLPTSSVFPTTSTMVENRMYFGAVAFSILIAFVAFRLGESFGPNKKLIQRGIFVAYIVALSVLSLKRSVVYANPMTLWEEVLTRYPGHYRAEYHLGGIFEAREDYTAAVKHYDFAIQKRPDRADAYNSLGNLYFKLGRYDQALNMFVAAIEKEPNRGEFYNNVGSLYYQLGQYQKALPYYLKMMELGGGSVVSTNIGSTYLQLKDYSNAEKFYLKAIELNSNDIDPYINLGALYLQINQVDKAIKIYESASAKAPSNTQLLNNLGAAYYKANMLEKALQVFQQVLGVNPNDKNAQQNIEILKNMLKNNHKG